MVREEKAEAAAMTDKWPTRVVEIHSIGERPRWKSDGLNDEDGDVDDAPWAIY